MVRRLRSAVLTLGLAAILSTAASLLAHAEFHRSYLAIFVLLGLAFALLVLGGLLFGRSVVRARGVVLRASRVAALAALLIPLTRPVVLDLDLWRLRRFVAQELDPVLQSVRRRSGSYPPTLSPAAVSLPPGPYLLSQVFFRPRADSYFLSVMDPGACGHVFTYYSKTRTWVPTQFECWY